MQQTDFHAQVFSNPVYRSFRGFDHATGSQDGIVGVFQPVRHHDVVLAAGQPGVFVHDCLQRWEHAVVPSPLGNLAFHVAVLVLNHTGHQRNTRIKQRSVSLGWMPDELLHQFRFGHTNVFDRMRGEESVLNIQEGSFGFFSCSSSDESQVAGLLRITREKSAPPAIRHAVHVIVTGMHIQGLRCQRASADVEYDGKTLSRNRIKNFLHQNQALA